MTGPEREDSAESGSATSRSKGEAKLPGEFHPERFSQQKNGPQTIPEAGRRQNDQEEKSDPSSRQIAKGQLKPKELRSVSVRGTHEAPSLSPYTQMLFGR